MGVGRRFGLVGGGGCEGWGVVCLVWQGSQLFHCLPGQNEL